MKSMNKVFLMGHVGHDPELQTTKKGQPFVRLSLATQRSWKDENEQKQELTDWHHVMVWGTQARICKQGVSKGSLVFIEGNLSPYSTQKENGEKEYHLSIHAQKVTFFSPRERMKEEVAS